MIDNKRLLDTFLDYVMIDSESGHEGAICRRLRADLEALGLSVIELGTQDACNSDGRTLMVLLAGDADSEPLILGAHLDTVIPGCGVEPVLCDDGYIRSRGETVLGSDDKSGVVAILEALRCVVEQKIPHRTVQALFTIREETGLIGSKLIDPGLLAAKSAVILDTSQRVGRIVTSSPGQLRLTATLFGKAAHAGNAPEQGVSAILVAARALDRMRLLRIDEETTANIGTFEAIGETNIVSPNARLIFEIRSRDTDKLHAQAKHMVGCLQSACEEMGGRLEYRLEESYLGYRFPDEHPLVQQIMTACRKIGVEPFTAATGGGSDANILNRNGIAAVNIATGMEKVHTTGEQISVENLQQIAALTLQLIKREED